MKILRSKIFSTKKEKEEDKTKAILAGAGTVGIASNVKPGRLTGKVTRYHNTESKNVDSILKNGIKSEYSKDPNNLTNTVLSDVDMSKKEGLVYTAKKKSTATSVGIARKRLKEKRTIPNLEDIKEQITGKSNKHKNLKLEFDYDEIKNNKRIKNPELRGSRNAKEFYEKRRGILNPKWENLSFEQKQTQSKLYKDLGEGTHIFKGDIDPSHIVGGKGYKKRTIKQTAKYIKNNPGRFGKEAAKVSAGIALGSYAAKKGYDSVKKDKNDNPKK